MTEWDYPTEAALLAADIAQLEHDNDILRRERDLAREMVSVLLDQFQMLAREYAVITARV